MAVGGGTLKVTEDERIGATEDFILQFSVQCVADELFFTTPDL